MNNGTTGDSEIKRRYQTMLREASDAYIAEMHAARVEAEKKRVQAVRNAQKWLREQDDRAYFPVTRNERREMLRQAQARHDASHNSRSCHAAA